MNTDFSSLLRTYRKNMGWTQEEMSQKWSYSFETISAWERKKRTPSSQEIPRLAKLLQIEAEKLADLIANSRGEAKSSPNKPAIGYEKRAGWKASFETWGEFQSIYRTRTEFNKEFSYPHMFENAHSILAVGISLNALALTYDRNAIIKAILENDCHIKMCFLDPHKKSCAEREQEEHAPPGSIVRLTQTNIEVMELLRKQIERTDQAKGKQLEIRVYDMIPRFNIYVVDDKLMTVQGYAYGRGEETPTLVLERKMNGGLFDFYVSTALHILGHSRDIREGFLEEKGYKI